MSVPELDVIKEIPGYKVILKAIVKNQIQLLVDQLSSSIGEECVLLIASVSDGSIGELGSESGKEFLQDNQQIKTQFLGFCLKRHAQISQNLQQSVKLPSEEPEVQPLSNHLAPLHFDSDVSAVALQQMPPQFLPLQLDNDQINQASRFDNAQLNVDPQFSADSASQYHECYSGKQRKPHKRRMKQASEKCGRRKRACSSRSPQGQVTNFKTMPIETEPESKHIKTDAPDSEIHSLVKSVADTSKGTIENFEEGPSNTGHTSSLDSLLNNEGLPLNCSIDQVPNNTLSQQDSFAESGDAIDIYVHKSMKSDNKRVISDNNFNRTGNAVQQNSRTRASKSGFRIVVHDSSDNVEDDLKTIVKEESLSEPEIDFQGSSDTLQNNNIDWLPLGPKPRRSSAEYMRWYRRRLKDDPIKRELQRARKKQQNEKYKQKVKDLRQKCEAFNEAMKVKQVMWRRTARQKLQQKQTQDNV